MSGMTKIWSKSIDKKKVVRVVFIDFQAYGPPVEIEPTLDTGAMSYWVIAGFFYKAVL